VGFISLRLIPPRGTKPVGKLDHRARCCSSLKAKRTLCRCFSLSVKRNVFAARTIRAVAVCAVAAVTDNQIAATAAMPRSILVAKKFTLLSLSVILNRSLKFTGLGSSFKKIVPSVRPRFNSSTLLDVVSLLPPAPIDEISFFRSPIRLGMRVQRCNFRASSTQTHNGPVYAYYFDRAIPWPAHPKFGAFHTGEIPYSTVRGNQSTARSRR
jgi:hypothetical protein